MVSAAVDLVPVAPPHPAHALLLGATIAPFFGAVLSYSAYTKTYQVQWSNFSSWLIAGGLVFGAGALICEWMNFSRAGRRRPLGAVVLLAMWVLGLINAFIHAGDAWATMPKGFVFSVFVFLLAIIATWLAFAGSGRRISP